MATTPLTNPLTTPLANPYDKLITTSRFLRKVKRFWKLRLEIQLSHVNALNALLADSDIPPHEGSLGAVMACAKELLRREVEHQVVAVQRLTSAYEAVEGLYPGESNIASHRCYLIRHAQVLRLRNDELAKRRAELEGEAGMAALLSYQPDLPLPIPESPTSPRFDLSISRLLQRRRRGSSISQTAPNIKFSPDSFHRADMNYRDACMKYNVRRQEILIEADSAVGVSVQFDHDVIKAVKGVITTFANAQCDFAEFLRKSFSRLTSMNINSYSDSDRFRVELRSGISNQIGLPHQYKNYEFTGCNSPIILFGCPIASEPLQDDSPAACAVYTFQRLAELTHSLGTPPRNDESEVVLRKVAHDLETHWDPEDRSGGPRVTSLLINPAAEASSGDLLIYFLRRLPEPLIPMQELDKHGNLWEPDPWDGKNLKRLTNACNRPWIGGCRRRMLVILGRLLSAINGGDPRTWWTWWITEDRAAYWSELLTRRGDAIAHLLPWWLFSITLKGTSIEIEDVKVNALRLI